MNKIHPKKLLNSKWTAVNAVNKQKHFVVSEVEFNDEQELIKCVIQAIMTKAEHSINWRNLRNQQYWLQGWK